MFHSSCYEVIKFTSNPPLDPIPSVERTTDDFGSPIPHYVMIPRSNKSPFEGAHYEASKHSLSAMLNLGIQLSPVGYGSIDNDPNVIKAKVLRYASSLSDALNSRLAAAQAAVVSSPSESSES